MPRSVQPADLVASLERFMLRCPKSAAGVTSTIMNGLCIRRTNVPMPLTNLIGMAEPGVLVADAAIEEAMDEFKQRDLPFGWLVGPNSPAGLVPRLLSHGMSRIQQFAGLAHGDLSREIPVSAGLAVSEVQNHDKLQFLELVGRSFELTPDVLSYMSDFYYFPAPGSGVHARNYWARARGVDRPVGFATSLHVDEDPIVTLAGAAVLPAHRNQGIYKALLRRRFRDALGDNLKAAVIQAVRSTSAPICRSLGFDEVCSQELYAWFPETARASNVAESETAGNSEAGI